MSKRTEFEQLVQIIIASPPKTGLGAKHFQAGLDPNYIGPSYGRSTMMDAYFEAGRRTQQEQKNEND